MRKDELIDHIANALSENNGNKSNNSNKMMEGVSKKTVERVFKAFEEVVCAMLPKLSAGDYIALTGFCTFKVKDRAATVGRNPSTGAKIQIAAHKAVSISVGKRLKDSMSGNKKTKSQSGSKKTTASTATKKKK